MKTILHALSISALLAMSSNISADDDLIVDAAIGGAVGGAVGGVVGAAVGGRDGAIIGAGVGAAAGTVISTSDDDYHYRAEHHSYRNYDDYDVHQHPYRFCPPGQAKKGRC